MRRLNTKEWIAVVVAVLVVGLVSLFNNTAQKINLAKSPEVLIQDTLVGGGEIAMSGNLLTVNYTGRFVDGKVFDSSVTRGEPVQFVLGDSRIIKGWSEGLAGMRVGGKRTISVPPELGYGANNYRSIPGGSTLIFDVELLKVQK